MVTTKVKIVNPSGLHLRPAGKLCEALCNYKSKITFESDGYSANAKSVLSVLGACIKQGDEITFICDGPDEEEAVRTIETLVGGGFEGLPEA